MAITLIHHKCSFCSKNFSIPLKEETSRKLKGSSLRFCCKMCASQFQKKTIIEKCAYCNITFDTLPCFRKKSKNAFCSCSCAAKYNNAHKTHGTRRSKLEVYLEEKLKEKYPNIEIHFNRKDTINSELDIYFPSLKLAFELNGIYHYEPIHGTEKLASVQNNDNRKFQACLEKGIDLCVIDVSIVRHFASNKGEKYLIVMDNIIKQKLTISQS